MVELHDQLGAFLDGELSPGEAEAFRKHLATCLECQRDLESFIQLEAVSGAKAPQQRVKPVTPPSRARVVVGMAALLAAGLAAFFVVRNAAAPPAPVALADARSLEARLTWKDGDVWRPYRPVRAAGAAAEAVSAATLAALEAAKDGRGLAGAWLLSGNAARARQTLAALAASPDVASDLAAVALLEGRDEDALALAQSALDGAPAHPQASWNRALACERLGLVRLAARAFHELEARAEPGWSKEAGARARALDAAWADGVARSQAALDAGARMVLDGQPMPLELARAMPSWARMSVRYALLTATSKERVLALAPLASALDAQLGGDGLQQAVARHAGADFAARAPHAARFRALAVDYYRALASTGFAPTVAQREAGLGDAGAWVATLRREKAWDFLLLAAPMGRQLDVAFDDYARAVARDGDPWFTLALELEQAKRALAAGEADDAERRFTELLSRAGHAPLRALQAHEQLALLHTAQHRVVEGATHALAALRLAQGQGEQAGAARLLHTLGDAARFRNASALAAAYLGELVLRRPDDCHARAYLHESSASMAISALDPKRARAELDLVPACDAAPLSVVGAGVLADLVRLAPQPGDSERLAKAVGSLRERGMTEGGAALLEHIEGRALLDAEPVRGEAKLREAIVHARAAPAVDAVPKKVRAHGFGLLRSAAGEAGRWDALFQLTGEELGATLPARCALLIEVQDNRVAVAVRDSAGAASGAARRFPFGAPQADGLTVEQLSEVATPLARAAAKGCSRLSVFASYPLHGRTGWLPDEVAWSYSSGGARAAPGGGQALVVRDVATPPGLGLERLASWDDQVAPGDVQLTHEAATPARVLEAMKSASFVELHVHARVNPADADTAALLLAPDEKQAFTLSARTLGHTRLEKNPVVVLAACRASTVAPFVHEPWSLPRALVLAGASAVIAAPVDLPDDEARLFFRAVAARVRRGEDAATVVRDERVAFLKSHRAPWVSAVLVFD